MIDFDEIVNRNTPEDIKHAKIEGIDDLIPMWVADMDFKSPDEVVKALVEQAQRGVFGYPEADESYDKAVTGWYKRRYGWDVDPKTVLKMPGVVLGISDSIMALTKEGDSILIFEPLYGPIGRAVKGSGRNLVVSDLVMNDSHYEIDFEDFENKVRENDVKMLIFCNPHNPAGRVWTREELLKVGDICLKNPMVIVCDEIHADFVYSGHKHIPIASLSEELKKITVTCTSATKSFNIAGIQAANIISSNRDILRRIDREAVTTGAYGLGKMGISATRAAYTYGEPWLNELISYLESNIDLLREELKDTGLKMMEPEGTYLVWIDCSSYGDLSRKLLTQAHVRVSEGTFFGADYGNFIRLNIACPRSVLKEALRRIKEIL